MSNNSKAEALKKTQETLKVVLVGDSSVGKSCLLVRWADDSFSTSNASTIGVDFRFRTLVSEKRVVKLQVWDTAGQERFKNVTSAYFRGSHGFIICVDLTSIESLNNCDYWFDEIEKHETGRTHAVKIIVGTKSDLTSVRQIEEKLLQEYAESRGALCIECSAKDGVNVDLVFLALTKEMIRIKTEKEKELKQSSSFTFNHQSINIMDTFKTNDFDFNRCCRG